MLCAGHPLNAGPVGAIVAQADLLSFAIVIWACLVALRPATLTRALACATVLLLAALVKESAIIFAPLVALLIALQPGARRTRWIAVVPTVIVTIAMVGIQLALPRRGTVTMWGNTLAHEVEGYRRIVLGLYTMGRSLMMSVWPHPLAPSHGYAAIERSEERRVGEEGRSRWAAYH